MFEGQNFATLPWDVITERIFKDGKIYSLHMYELYFDNQILHVYRVRTCVSVLAWIAMRKVSWRFTLIFPSTNNFDYRKQKTVTSFLFKP